MPIIKRYPDGSMFDYENGHRTAETVARQKAAGTYSEPESELQDPQAKKRFVISSLVMALVAIIASIAIWNFATNTIYESSKKQFVMNEIAKATGGEILDTKDNDKILLRIHNEDAHAFEGPEAENHANHTIVVPCEAEDFTENGETFAAVYCTGFPSSLIVKLPA